MKYEGKMKKYVEIMMKYDGIVKKYDCFLIHGSWDLGKFWTLHVVVANS